MTFYSPKIDKALYASCKNKIDFTPQNHQFAISKSCLETVKTIFSNLKLCPVYTQAS